MHNARSEEIELGRYRERLYCAGETTENALKPILLDPNKNLTTAEPIPNLHIATRYDNIVVEAVPEMRRWILSQGAEFHARLRNYLSRYDKDFNPALYDRQAGAKVVVGSFSHCRSESAATLQSLDRSQKA